MMLLLSIRSDVYCLSFTVAVGYNELFVCVCVHYVNLLSLMGTGVSNLILPNIHHHAITLQLVINVFPAHHLVQP